MEQSLPPCTSPRKGDFCVLETSFIIFYVFRFFNFPFLHPRLLPSLRRGVGGEASVLEGASSCELSEQACRRHLFAWNAAEVSQKLAQATCLSILHGPLRHLLKDGHHLLAYHSYLVEKGTIERRVGKVLEGENPLLLASPDARTALDGLYGRESTVAIVADDAAKQADVGRRDVVVVVQLNGGQR